MGKKHKKSSSKSKEKEYDGGEGKERSESLKDEKPLPKLVLKVHKEVSEDVSKHSGGEGTPKDKHKKKKKKDKKHKLRDEEGRRIKRKERSFEDKEHEPPVKKIHIRVVDLITEDVSPVHKSMPFHEPILSPLRLCLENLLRSLQRKDVYSIFAYPVTDAVAPGYSIVIKEPMDFSTMMKKIENNEYASIEKFRDDFVLMCNNAMMYNAPDTIYYKTASKLLSIGLRMMSKHKILHLKQSIGFDDSIDVEDLDSPEEHQEIQVHDEETVIEDVPLMSLEKKRKEPKPLKIADQILRSARMAYERLKKRNPEGKIGYLRKDKDGNTSLAILNPDSSGVHMLPISLGKLAGRVRGGTTASVATKEEKKNKVHSVSSLAYGPYGSFGPTYDSSLATVTKEDSDMLLNTYGCDVGVEYAQSLQKFVQHCEGFAQNLVDKFLDALTEGAHSTYVKRQQQKKREELIKVTSETLDSATMNSLLSLEAEGIDMSFLNDMVQAEGENIPQADQESILSKLQANSILLNDLQSAQTQRLNQRNVSKTPTDEEMNITKHLTDNFKQLLAKVHPSDIMDVSMVRSAMGVGPMKEDGEEDPAGVAVDNRLGIDLS